MTTRRALHAVLLLLSLRFGAGAVFAQSAVPLIFSVTAQLEGRSETQRLTLPADLSTSAQHVTLLERTHTYDVGDTMPRPEWEAQFAAGQPDDTIPLGCDTNTCKFIRHRWAKTGVDVTLRPLAVSVVFQPLSIEVTLHRFQPATDAQTPAKIDTWTLNLDTSLRVGDSKTLDLDGRGVLTIERLAAP
ncbi:hypothetical protein [Ralstonia sp. 24A2]|uniref:hypothetical protein n=1 Tax=Ralstonia sp. 24A2 TaxID=3447364 RepID=UPI003F6962E5